MRREYRHYRDREEFHPDGGMWKIVGQVERDAYAMVAADLMAFPDRFEDAMLRALEEWPQSCDVNLTAHVMNRRAWLGHAGCFLATGSPEDATRLGWRSLTAAQQFDADEAAERVIAEWSRRRRLRVLGGQIPLFRAGDR